jgi:hypothetical protein
MAVIRQRWGWRTWTWVASLTILAGLAGVGSELMAGATVTHFSFKGAEVYAEWDRIPTGTILSSGWVDATAGTTGPGHPTPTNTATIVADSWDTTSGYEITMSAWSVPFGSPSDFLTVDPNLASGSTAVTIPGTLNIWDWSTSTVNSVPATAYVNASLQNSGTTFNSKSITRQFDRNTGTDSRTKVDAKEAVDPTGSGGYNIVDANGNTYQIVAPNTPPSFAFFQNVNQGDRTVISH